MNLTFREECVKNPSEEGVSIDSPIEEKENESDLQRRMRVKTPPKRG